MSPCWLGLAHYNDQASTNKCVWMDEQHELLLSANRQALKHIRQSAEKSQDRVSGKIHISLGNCAVMRPS